MGHGPRQRESAGADIEDRDLMGQVDHGHTRRRGR
jgi:hypothetical protein